MRLVLFAVEERQLKVNRKWAAAATCAAAMLVCTPAHAAVGGLETDAAAEPLGIDDATPRFSWRTTGAERALKQSSYRVVVATTAAKAAAGTGDVWDSGEVATGDPFAEYKGPALASRTRYYWAVKTDAWSAPSWFETAYLSAADWKGDWISGPQRIERRLTYAEGAADDACCVKAATTLSQGAAAGATNVKVAGVSAFTENATVDIDGETATIQTVGTPTTRTTLGGAAAVGATSIRVNDITWIRTGDTLTVDAETVTVTTITPSNFGASTVNLAAPLTQAHANAAPVFDAGSGLTL